MQSCFFKPRTFTYAALGWRKRILSREDTSCIDMIRLALPDDRPTPELANRPCHLATAVEYGCKVSLLEASFWCRLNIMVIERGSSWKRCSLSVLFCFFSRCNYGFYQCWGSGEGVEIATSVRGWTKTQKQTTQWRVQTPNPAIDTSHLNFIDAVC